jgi:hypothetical protein
MLLLTIIHKRRAVARRGGGGYDHRGQSLVLRRPASSARQGWAEAARKIAEAGDDALVMGEFSNAADAELAW